MAGAPKRLAVLGSTGIIGRLCLEIVRDWPDRFQVVSLAAGNNIDLLARQVETFRPRLVSVSRKDDAEALRSRVGRAARVVSGEAGLIEAASLDEADLVVTAVVGFAGLAPTLAAIEAGKQVALANKECLVAGGRLIMGAARAAGREILPIDSEISAIYQSLAGQRRQDLKRVILTASGGPFLRMSRAELEKVTPERALAHPTWEMGPKITIDSATLMNKGLEAIEAAWLFGLDPDQVDVHIHPGAVVHSAVEYLDGSVIAQLAAPDMRLPIAYALAHPERLPLKESRRLDLFNCGPLVFEPPDLERFPCLRLAGEAARLGRSAPVVLNAANEVAVESFLNGRIGFMGIPTVVGRTLAAHGVEDLSDLSSVYKVDQWARKTARELINDML